MNEAEELAEEYERGLDLGEEVDEPEYNEYTSSDIETAFIAGYEAGKPKWHKVADEDLPTENGDYLVYMSTGERRVTTYERDYGFYASKVVIWCEIPEYEGGINDSRS